MNKKNILIIAGGVFVLGAIFVAYVLFFQPNRDTQSVEAAFKITSEELVNNCLTDLASTNAKLLSDDGESEVFVVTGSVVSSETDQSGKTIVFLSGGEGKPLARCTFITAPDAQKIKTGNQINVKGVFRSCAEIDEDLDLAEDAIIDQCALID